MKFLLPVAALLGFAAGQSSDLTSTTSTWDISGNPAATPKPQALTLKINRDSGVRNKTAPLLHGLFFEDINHSGDGGLYAELIRNRAFQGSDIRYGGVPGFPGGRIIPEECENTIVPWGPTLTAWKAIGRARLTLDLENPLSDALKTVMRVDIPSDLEEGEEIGFANEGWWGINVEPQDYQASFYIKPSHPLHKPGSMESITVSLRSNATSEVFGSSKISIPTDIRTTNFTQFHTTITPTEAAPSSNNTFAITFPKGAAGQSFFFSLISLFPPTYKDRPNGLRKDLAQVLADLEPKFLRFPGGNNLEGQTIDTRWQWKKNIGPLTDRAGRPGDWQYYNTDGLGYLEFLEWCEDMEIEPLLTVYAGYSLDDSGLHPSNTVREDEIQFYIDEAIEQIEYANGGLDTKWGALRAAHGHPVPFNISIVEIGNEDWFSDSYPWRFPLFLSALQAAYPNITYIASQAIEASPANQDIAIPPGVMWDLHHYETPQFFKNGFNFFDNFNTVYNLSDVQIFVGEYSVLSRDREGGVDWTNGEGRFEYPTTIAAIGEAIFALAMERNPHVVTLSSYAPLLQNFNAYQWTPNFIAFAADPKDTVLSTSYWMQLMFSHYKGEETLTVTNTVGGFDPVWWHASREGERVFVKLVNAGPIEAPVTLDFDFTVSQVNGTILGHEDEFGFNYRNNATAIVPRKFDVEEGFKEKTLEWTVPGFSVVVLEVN